jgi:hypothetical protein
LDFKLEIEVELHTPERWAAWLEVRLMHDQQWQTRAGI